jgi:hypothetical protein
MDLSKLWKKQNRLWFTSLEIRFVETTQLPLYLKLRVLNAL